MKKAQSYILPWQLNKKFQKTRFKECAPMITFDHLQPNYQLHQGL